MTTHPSIGFVHAKTKRLCYLDEVDPRRFAWKISTFSRPDPDDVVGCICAEHHDPALGEVVSLGLYLAERASRSRWPSTPWPDDCDCRHEHICGA